MLFRSIEAKRLLKPGGVFLAVTHNRLGLVNRLLGRRSPIWDVEHLQLFCPSTLARLLAKAGFEHVRVVPFANTYPLRYWLKLAPMPNGMKQWLIRHPSKLLDLPVRLRVGNMLGVGFHKLIP